MEDKSNWLKASKHAFTWLIILTLLKIINKSSCIDQNCKSNTFPIVHGGYSTTFFGDTNKYTLEFCTIIDPIIVDIGIFSNSDIVLIYEALNSYFSSNTDTANVIARIDHETGKTLWAKAFIYSYQSISWEYFMLSVIDDYAWIFIECDILFNYYGGVMKFDQNGNQLFTKAFSNSLSGNKMELRYFLFGGLVKYNDSSFIFNGKIAYSQSGVGYSADSYIDQIIFSADNEINIEWASIFDYKQTIDTK